MSDSLILAGNSDNTLHFDKAAKNYTYNHLLYSECVSQSSYVEL